ncbi:site-specific integrase [Pseudonocardia spinosispora]|uniref:site-specific integrase n=1 Tax=Pseudonocardia spinosispora TaxID=103441 RepID=UPI000409DB6E|nr:site-specific integrase [Pseudonocardia spinosispora]
MSALVLPGSVQETSAGSIGSTAALIGPDMTQLWQRFPPRLSAPSWPATEQGREPLLARLSATPFLVEEDRVARQRRRLGLVRLLDWLEEQPGDTWQQRWQASDADMMGNADWWHPMLAWARPQNPHGGVSTGSNLRVCALLLAGADVIRPSLAWVLTPRAPQNLVAIMARARDPEGFTELATLCATSPAGRTMKAAALRRAATILAVKGGTLREITVGDCLELSVAVDGRSLRANKGMGFYQLLHAMGVFGPHAPSTIRAFGTRGQLSPTQLIDRYGIAHRPIRGVLVAYLQERQPMLDHTTLRELAFSLGALFWRDLERHHPGIASLHLAPEVAAAWKQRVLTKTRRVTGPDGLTSEVRERRAGALHNLAAVRAFYLDIAQWAMEDPARWGPWAAPCPIRADDLARQKEIRSRKSRTDQRTRERLPLLPMLLSRVNDMRSTTAAALAAARAARPGESFPAGGRTLRRAATSAQAAARIWGEDPDTARRHDLTGEEDRAFWTWASIETLRHTGIRIEELTELSHHSLIHYTLPSTGEPVPLLQIAPSKTDTERLLVISPELADVLAAIITRICGRDGALGCVASYDTHERIWNPPMPLLFQRRFGLEHRAIPAATIREWISGAFDGADVTDAAGQPLRFTPHDFRRLFITDAVLHGMPPHIAQLVAGHRDINTTMGYKAVYPDEVINGHRAFIARRRALRPSTEYRVPTEQEWEEFLGHFERRKLALGTCGRSYATPCIHEHSCLRCPLLRPDPAHRARLVEIRDNLHARIAEARREGWLGEVDSLQISLTGARQKLAQLDQLATRATSTHLGMPRFPQIAGRSVLNPDPPT